MGLESSGKYGLRIDIRIPFDLIVRRIPIQETSREAQLTFLVFDVAIPCLPNFKIAL
jgi:hypothetical protein